MLVIFFIIPDESCAGGIADLTTKEDLKRKGLERNLDLLPIPSELKKSASTPLNATTEDFNTLSATLEPTYFPRLSPAARSTKADSPKASSSKSLSF